MAGTYGVKDIDPRGTLGRREFPGIAGGALASVLPGPVMANGFIRRHFVAHPGVPLTVRAHFQYFWESRS
jgi:hypothetical protein